ncbi:putative F-box protein At3g52320 [Capsella rubella]|uniref:putative F-box protein At3g52320 n=1 Tax=Capsella rubella TaxID=81985 RepID=UPI000CD4C810|nr:putative F-box protein At3g52320 [Capsella rubella]
MRFSFRLATGKRERKKIRTVVKPEELKTSIPENVMLLEILPRLPAKSLMRFKCVSKLWCSFISSRYLTNLFLKSPYSAQGRRVFMSFVDREEPYFKYALVSSSHGSVPVISPYDSVPVSNLDQDLDMHGIEGFFVNALRGLVCFRIGTRVRICNLTTRQYVNLPLLRSRIMAAANDNIWNYFGHDPVQDEYKVLSTVWEVSEEERVVRSEHHVLVLGPQASWRNTKSTVPPPPHRPYSQGITINGVLYYGAWIDKNRCVIMSFDMRSEDMDVWVVMDAGKSQWSDKKTYVLPNFQTLAMSNRLLIQATSHSCEIRLSKEDIYRPRSAIYDLEKNKITRHIQSRRPCSLKPNAIRNDNNWCIGHENFDIGWCSNGIDHKMRLHRALKKIWPLQRDCHRALEKK